MDDDDLEMRPIVRAVHEWLLAQTEHCGPEEEFDVFLERFEIVDGPGLYEAGLRVSRGVYTMIDMNGLEGGLATHTVLCLILGAHLHREGLL